MKKLIFGTLWAGMGHNDGAAPPKYLDDVGRFCELFAPIHPAAPNCLRSYSMAGGLKASGRNALTRAVGCELVLLR